MQPQALTHCGESRRCTLEDMEFEQRLQKWLEEPGVGRDEAESIILEEDMEAEVAALSKMIYKVKKPQAKIYLACLKKFRSSIEDELKELDR